MRRKLRFSLAITDPVESFLAEKNDWAGIRGFYIINLGSESKFEDRSATELTKLSDSVNAFSWFWFGVRPTVSLAITDQLAEDPDFLSDKDHAIRLTRPIWVGTSSKKLFANT